MSSPRSLLVELFVEELPPKALKALGEAFTACLREHLEANDFLEPHSVATAFASPRRLAAHLSAVRATSQPRPREPRTLMPTSVAFKDGQPTQALIKRLMREGFHEGVDIGEVIRDRTFVAADGGKDVVKFRDDAPAGSTLLAGLQGAIDQALAKLPIPKLMSYQLADGWTSVQFVRPAHGLVALHGADVVAVTALGLESGRDTRGHRFEASIDPVRLQHADQYAQTLLEQGAVIASFAQRHGEISRQLQHAAAREGLAPIDDPLLLDEVTALVERPNVLVGRFDAAFLEVPQECLILTMKANQKYFPLLDAAGRLTNKFLIVSNIRPDDASAVVGGNERVVRPRLADAKFFFDQDRRKRLEDRVDGLDRVVYHARLGSMGERVGRVRSIARAIGRQMGGEALEAQADHAARLAKADLLTDMVGEFPELQGTMGRYYALHDGLPEAVADAIEDHYRPRFAGDALPRGDVGLVVALADKLETLAGLFGIGQLPTGDKDPFALRRHALGVIRMLIERELPLEPAHLISLAFAAFPATLGQAHAELAFFLRERLVGYLRDAGFHGQDVEAVVEARPARWADFPKRLDAVRAFKSLPESQPLAAANKRVGNILKKSEHAVVPEVDAALLAEPAERALHEALRTVGPRSAHAFDAGDYTGSLQALAALKAPVDAFFDAVMVNTDDAALRANRLGLLATLHAAMNRVADLSRLAA